MSAPLFSIITVTLNSGGQLARTIESVRAQEFDDYEHIIKDGESSDGSIQSVPLDDLRYRPIIIRGRDSGIYDAMNCAVSASCGKYVVFLNAGDIFASSKVLVSVAERIMSGGEADLFYTDFAAGNHQRFVASPPRLNRFYLYRTMLCHQACFIRRHCFENIGRFDIKYKVLADYDWLIRLIIVSGGCAAHVAIVGPVFAGGGVSSNPKNFPAMERELACIRRRHFPLVERGFFALLLAVTFPGVRLTIARSPKWCWLSSSYLRLRNLLYEWERRLTVRRG